MYGIGGDDRRDRAIAHPQPHLGEESVDSHLVDESLETIARAQATKRLVGIGRAGDPPVARLLVRHEAVDLRIRDAMVTALGTCRPHVARVDPPLERGVRDT